VKEFMETLMRNFFLYMSSQAQISQAAKKYGLKFGAAKFVAGVTIEDAMRVVKEHNEAGIVTTLDHLGENIHTEAEALASTEHNILTLRAIAESGVKSHLSVKMTQLGMDIDRDLLMRNMRNILDVAKETENFVRIDMEDFAHYSDTLAIFRTLRAEYGETVGTVMQAYLYNICEDIAGLHDYHPNLRLVKGAYKEAAEVAFPKKEDVDRNYVKMIEQHLLAGDYASIATHDDAVIDHVKQFVVEHNIPRTRFEFQMLFGIRTHRHYELAKEGYTMRVYVPFGDDWYGYFMRRLAERPANVGFVVKSFFK
jgi:proline dehydrogenase